MSSLIKSLGSIALSTVVGAIAAPVIVGAAAGAIPTVALSAISVGLLSAEKAGKLKPGMSRTLIPIATLLIIITMSSLFFLFSLPLIAILAIAVTTAIAGYILTPKAGYYLTHAPSSMEPNDPEINTALKSYSDQINALGYDPTLDDLNDNRARKQKYTNLTAIYIQMYSYLSDLKTKGLPLIPPEEHIVAFNNAQIKPTYT